MYRCCRQAERIEFRLPQNSQGLPETRLLKSARWQAINRKCRHAIPFSRKCALVLSDQEKLRGRERYPLVLMLDPVPLQLAALDAADRLSDAILNKRLSVKECLTR